MMPWCPRLDGQHQHLDACHGLSLELAERGLLDRKSVEAVLMPSLQRVHDWLLDLPVASGQDEGAGGSIRDYAWRQAVGSWEQGQGLEAGLGCWVESLFAGLSAWRVWPKPGRHAGAPCWGGFSMGLRRWCEVQDIDTVWLESAHRSWGGWCTAAHWAGRVLAGESWHYLERNTLVLSQPEHDVSLNWYKPLMHRLVGDNLWDPCSKPGRLWRDDGGWWWLWPLAMRDMWRVLEGQGNRADDLSFWIGAGLVAAQPGEVAWARHPLLGREVSCVRPASTVQSWLDTWLSSCPR